MSLSRTALRLATILALSDKGRQEPVAATLAGKRVHDTLMEPEHLFGADKPVPLIVVYTDDDEGANRNMAGGSPTFDRTCALTLELGCATTRKTPDGVEIGMPQTDAELEAVLDLLEYQVRVALTDPASRWARLWGKLTRGIVDYSSTRVMDAKGETRMAARTVTYRVKLPDDCPPMVATSEPEESGIEALPPPLRAVAAAVADASGGNALDAKGLIAWLMDAEIPVTTLLPALLSVGLEIHSGETEDGLLGVVTAEVDGLDGSDGGDPGDDDPDE